MNTIRSTQVDKVASLAAAQNLGRELRLSDDIVCEEGVLVAVEVLNNKSRYNTLELTSGRMAVVKRGDIVVVALGHPTALFGYSAHIPEPRAPRDTPQPRNIDGVLGCSVSVTHDPGDPFDR